jgi:serine/threonine protein kinase
MNPSTGSVLSNRYTLTEHIASGGMGQVWAATDTVLGRTVAVKLLSSSLSQESSFVERFRAEARHTAALHHPNITTVFDYGEDNGSAYLVMELVAGQPLSQIISERAPLSAQETASILIQAATALEAAHQGGVVHRDVKPANILITAEGTAKLTDFGISRLANTAPLTQAGQVLGTAQYLSPEQAMGQSATASGDIYALGVVGYEMLTGQRPLDRDTVVATALAHVNEPSPELPETVPIGIRSVIGAALAKDPADRPESAAAMAHALGMPDAPFAGGRVAGVALAAATLAVPLMTLPARTQVIPAMPAPGMPARSLPPEPPGIPDGRSRRRIWVLTAIAAAVVIGVLTAFALSAGSGNVSNEAPVVTPPAASTPSPTPTPTPTSTPTATPTPTPTPTSTPAASTDAPAVVEPPAVLTPAPRRGNRRNGNGGNGNGGKGDNKDGN